VKAVCEGLRIPAVPPDPELRAELEARAEREGELALYAELQQVDPAAATRIDPRNLRRTIRALEVHRLSGRRFSELGRSEPPSYRVLTIGLSLPRPELYARIDARIDRMIAAGLVDETQRLAERYDWSLPSMSGLGYRQIGTYLRGECALDEAIAAIKRDTRRFVRHQANWFRPHDPHIIWREARGESARDLEGILRRALDAVQ
jgi:tRNA dimethylallyltransferase